MNETKLRQLSDYQKFEKNSAMDFAIQSARNFINSQERAGVTELSSDELDMLNAAGTTPLREEDKDS